MVGFSGTGNTFVDVGGDLPHIEDRRLIGRREVDIQPKNPLTLLFMKYTSQTKKCMSESGEDLDCSSQRGFNLAPWRVFGQIGSSASGSCTVGTTVASGPGLRWNAPREELSVVGISAHFVVDRSKILATHGSMLSPKRWAYPLERGWKRIRARTLSLRIR